MPYSVALVVCVFLACASASTGLVIDMTRLSSSWINNFIAGLMILVISTALGLLLLFNGMCIQSPTSTFGWNILPIIALLACSTVTCYITQNAFLLVNDEDQDKNLIASGGVFYSLTIFHASFVCFVATLLLVMWRPPYSIHLGVEGIERPDSLMYFTSTHPHPGGQITSTSTFSGDSFSIIPTTSIPYSYDSNRGGSTPMAVSTTAGY